MIFCDKQTVVPEFASACTSQRPERRILLDQKHTTLKN